MSFRAQLDQAKSFKHTIVSLRECFTDASLDCTSEGIFIQMMDASQTLFAKVQWNAEAFKSYLCPKEFILDLSLVQLTKMLHCVDKEDTLTLLSGTYKEEGVATPGTKRVRAAEEEEEEPSKKRVRFTAEEAVTTSTSLPSGTLCTFEPKSDNLYLIAERPEKNKRIEIELHLLDLQSDNLTIPDMQFDCTITLPSVIWNRILTQLLDLSDQCQLLANVTNQTVTLSSVNGTIGNGNTTLKASDDTVIQMRAANKKNDTFAMRFSMIQLHCISKSFGIASTVQVSFSPDAPIRIHYEMENRAGFVTYYLAPRLDDVDKKAEKAHEEEEEEG